MQYISPKKEYPRYAGDIMLEYPDWKEGDTLPEGWVSVEYSDYPFPDKYEVVDEAFPVEVNGVMKQNWQVRPMTPEEIERKDAPETAKAKLRALGLTDLEIEALTSRIR